LNFKLKIKDARSCRGDPSVLRDDRRELAAPERVETTENTERRRHLM
jgi:hypothetical protein